MSYKLGRMGRGYKPAAKYMNVFVSPMLAVLAKNVAFFSGSVFAVLIALTVYDEDVLTVQHILTAITVLGVVITITRYGKTFAFIHLADATYCTRTRQDIFVRANNTHSLQSQCTEIKNQMRCTVQ